MKQFIYIVLFLFAFLNPGQLFAARLKPFTALYSIKYHLVPAGVTTRTLQYDHQGRYHFTSTTHSSLFFIPLTINENSTGEYSSKIKPHEYTLDHRFLFYSHLTTIIFSWAKGVALTNHDNDHYETPIKVGIQDNLSYQLSIRNNLLNHQSQLSPFIINDGKINQFVFHKLNTETIKTPLGNIKTIKYRYTDQLNEKVLDFWLAPQYQYLLIKMIDIEKGRLVRSANIYQVRFDKE